MHFEVNEHGWQNKQFYAKGVSPADTTQADSIFDTSTDQITLIFAFSLKLSPIIFFPPSSILTSPPWNNLWYVIHPRMS